MSGLFITFEGADGCGKTTQAERLATALRERGLDVVATREPGGTALGGKLRKLMLNSGADGPVPTAEMLLMAADRTQHVHEVVLPALKRGAIVVSDRFVDSSIAYQAGGLRLPEEDVRRVNTVATGGLLPRLTIWLQIPAGRALERADGRGAAHAGLDRIERRGVEFQKRVIATYEQLAAEHPERWRCVDVTHLSVEDVATRVDEIVEPLLLETGFVT